MKHCLACKRDWEGTEWRCPSCSFEPKIDNGFPVFAPELAHANNGFDIRSFEKLNEIEEASLWFQTRNELILWAFRKYFGGARSLLEIGCGTGYVLRALQARLPADAHIVGADIYVEGLNFARRRLGGRASYIQVDATNLPYRNEFDVIGAFDVIEHIEDDVAAMRQVYEALKPGGGFFMIVPAHQFLWSRVDDLAHHKRRYARRELFEKIECVGFTIGRLTSFLTLLMPLQYLSRRIVKQKGEELTELLENDVPSIGEPALRLVRKLENNLTYAGIDFPFGGSLLAIARKPQSERIRTGR